MKFDEDGRVDEPCLSCDKSYVDNIYHEWHCDEIECFYAAKGKGKNWYENKKRVNNVFDKIKTEIMKIQTYKTFLCEDYVKRDDVLAIIDKCKEESEGWP